MVQVFINNCQKATPPWTEKEKLNYRQKAKAKAILVTKSLHKNPKLMGAQLRATDWPEAINASCYEARAVSIDGVVAKPEQKRVLEDISREHSDNEINVTIGAIGSG